jgi:RNA polymerase sigma factor (sigma-70 family)
MAKTVVDYPTGKEEIEFTSSLLDGDIAKFEEWASQTIQPKVKESLVEQYGASDQDCQEVYRLTLADIIEDIFDNDLRIAVRLYKHFHDIAEKKLKSLLKRREEKTIVEGLHENKHDFFNTWADKNLKPSMRSLLISKWSANINDVEEVYNKSMDALVMNLLENKFRWESNLSTYFNKIACNQMCNLIKDKIRNRPISDENLTSELWDHEFSFDEQQTESINIEIIKKCINNLKEPCRTILDGKYKGYSLKIIANESQYSESHLKNNSISCQNQLKEKLIKNGFSI